MQILTVTWGLLALPITLAAIHVCCSLEVVSTWTAAIMVSRAGRCGGDLSNLENSLYWTCCTPFAVSVLPPLATWLWRDCFRRCLWSCLVHFYRCLKTLSLFAALTKASAKAIYQLPCFDTSRLSLRLIVTSSAPIIYFHPLLLVSPLLGYWSFKAFLCFVAIMLKATFHGKYIIMTLWILLPWRLMELSRNCCGVGAATCCLLSESRMFQPGSFAFVQHNNRLSLSDRQLLCTAAYGVVWSELHKTWPQAKDPEKR